MTKLHIMKIGRVCITVADAERAIAFYVGVLGFTVVVDTPIGPNMRWVEVQVPGTPTTIALGPAPDGRPVGGAQTGITFDSSNLLADHAALLAAGADVDAEITTWGGMIPPMFWLRDPDGNSLIIIQPLTPGL